MKVLLVNTLASDGGAARAAQRLLWGLRRSGIDAQMHVQQRRSSDQWTTGPSSPLRRAVALARPTIDRLPVYRYRNHQRGNFSTAWLPNRQALEVNRLTADIVHLNWVTGGFIRPEALPRIAAPIVWTLHDMWPFTGGCHYDGGCNRFRDECGRCPLLASTSQKDLSWKILRRKHKAWSKLRQLTLVAPSRWIADCAASSRLFRHLRIETIPNGVDTGVFRPVEKQLARQLFGLPDDKHLVLFGAVRSTSDARKGYNYLSAALERLAQQGWNESVELVVFGASDSDRSRPASLASHFVGTLHDDSRLAALYSAADVFVAPSLQENLSNTVLESLACGTPCIAFDIGGMPDMIRHQENGYLAMPLSAEDLANGIAWSISNEHRLHTLSQAAVDTVTNGFSLGLCTDRHTALYRSILDDRRHET